MLIGIPIFAPKLTYNINKSYVDYVFNAGHIPILINQHNINNDNEGALFTCDAFLLPGGIDIDPTYYDEQNVGSFYANPEKDAFERRILNFAGATGKKIFGICRGFQLIAREILHNENLYHAIYFHQHVEHHASVNDLEISRGNFSHKVNFGDHQKFVNSIHHQALVSTTMNIGDKSNGESTLKIEAMSENIHDVNNIVEAISGTFNNAQYYAVQWHPEELNDTELLTHFLEEN